MKKLLLLLLIASLTITLTGCSLKKNSDKKETNLPQTKTSVVGDITFNYIIDDDQSVCQSVSDCQAINYGCGKTVCTDSPDRYKDLITDCSINKDQPSLNGYRCGCVPTGNKKDNGQNEHKCAWLK